ncbi:unnamed protein product [Rhodiola kirilowii]
MVDSRPVMEQYNELMQILGQFTQYNRRWMIPFRCLVL